MSDTIAEHVELVGAEPQGIEGILAPQPSEADAWQWITNLSPEEAAEYPDIVDGNVVLDPSVVPKDAIHNAFRTVFDNSKSEHDQRWKVDLKIASCNVRTLNDPNNDESRDLCLREESRIAILTQTLHELLHIFVAFQETRIKKSRCMFNKHFHMLMAGQMSMLLMVCALRFASGGLIIPQVGEIILFQIECVPSLARKIIAWRWL